jgi:hypothetical protein
MVRYTTQFNKLLKTLLKSINKVSYKAKVEIVQKLNNL